MEAPTPPDSFQLMQEKTSDVIGVATTYRRNINSALEVADTKAVLLAADGLAISKTR